jgi:hypothetical protein
MCIVFRDQLEQTNRAIGKPIREYLDDGGEVIKRELEAR